METNSHVIIMMSTDHNSQTQLNNDWKADDEQTERYGDGNG